MAAEASFATTVSMSPPPATGGVTEDDVFVLARDGEFMSFFFQHLTSCPARGPFRFYAALTFVSRARHRYGPAGLGGGGRPLGVACAAAEEEGRKETGSSSTPSPTPDDPSSAAALQRHREEEGEREPQRYNTNADASTSITRRSANDTRRTRSPVTQQEAEPPVETSFVSVEAAQRYKAIRVENILKLIEDKFDSGHLKSWPLFYVPSEVHSSDVEKLLMEVIQETGDHKLSQ